MGKYSVVFATDENYIQHLSVALLSLLKNNSNLKFKIYIISNEINEVNFAKLKKISDPYDAELHPIIISDDIFENLVTRYHFTKANYYRLLIPNFINDNIVLYLDVDIVVNGSLSELFNIDLGNSYVAAVVDPGFNRHKELKMSPDAEYFNSGVMLINNELWKKDQIPDKVIEFVKNNPDVIHFVDQCGLNAIINGNFIKLPPKFNQQTVFFEKDFEKKYNCFSIDELNEARNNPVIVHYTGSSKPWHFRNKHPYKYLYWKYRRMTPFKSYIPEDLTFVNIVKWIVPDVIKKHIKKRL